MLSIGLGVDIVRGSTHWNYNRIFSSPVFTSDKNVLTEVETSGTGTGFSTGILFQPSDKIGIGVRYQHKVKISLEGKTKFSTVGSIIVPHPTEPDITINDIIDDFYSYEAVTSTMTMPAEFVIGIKVAPTKKFSFHLDLNWTGWSEFNGIEYNTIVTEQELQQRFYDIYGDFYGILPDWASQVIEMELNDVWNYKFGVEYSLGDHIDLRAGYARSQSPLPDEYLNPFLPVLSRNVISFGVGYDGPVRTVYEQKLMGALTFDLFIQYVMGESRTSAQPGYEFIYDSSFLVVGCGVGLKL
jgi:long-chain fatty acid transport protein